MDEILELLQLVGYTPQDELDFLKLTRGIHWLMSNITGFTPTPVTFDKRISSQIMISEAITKDLYDLKFPYALQPHQIQGLDTNNLLPVIQWLVLKTKEHSSTDKASTGSGSSRLEFSKFGRAVEVLELKSGSEIPVPQRNEIVVRVSATPIHPSILGLIKGTYGHKPSLPSVPGNEGTGVVHALGENVTEFIVGQRVCFSGSEGLWSHYVVLKKQEDGSFIDTPVLAVDDNVPDDFAAQFYVNPVTAYVMMFEVLNVDAGKWLIQSASGSTLGRVVIQLAKHKGINLINLVRRAEQVEELQKEFGQDTHVVVFDGTNSDEALKHIKEITNNQGVNYGVDAVAGTTTELIMKSLAQFGKVLVYGVLNGIELKLNAAEMLFKETSVTGFWLSPWLQRNTRETRQRVYESVMQLMSKKIVTPFVEARYPFTEYIAAINHSMQKGKSGKVLLEWK